MGYGAQTFSTKVDRWLSSGWMFSGCRLLEFGSQEFYSEQEPTRADVRDFLTKRGKTEIEIRKVIGAGGLFPVANVYRALAIDYTSIDVDGMYDCTYVDLNSFKPRSDWIGRFDFVNNEGTVEHLVNPINGFQFAHEVTKLGGVMRHSGPLTGFPNHGFFYATAKYYAHLVGDNGYEVLSASVRFHHKPARRSRTPCLRMSPRGCHCRTSIAN